MVLFRADVTFAAPQASEAAADLKRHRQERARLDAELVEAQSRLQRSLRERTDCDRDVLTARQRAEAESGRLAQVRSGDRGRENITGRVRLMVAGGKCAFRSSWFVFWPRKSTRAKHCDYTYWRKTK